MINEYNYDNIVEQLDYISKIIAKENYSEKVTQIFNEMILI